MLHIIHHGKRLSNNSRILVEDGDPLLLECGINFSETKKSGSPTLLRPKQFVWKTSENETVSYSPKLDLPNVYYPEEKTQEETPSSGGVINYRCGLLYEKKAFKWAHVAVKVTKPPSFTIRREPAFGIPVQEDMTVTLSCDIEIEEELKASLMESGGNPLSAKWLKNEHPVTSEGTFLIARYGLKRIFFCLQHFILNTQMSKAPWWARVSTKKAFQSVLDRDAREQQEENILFLRS